MVKKGKITAVCLVAVMILSVMTSVAFAAPDATSSATRSENPAMAAPNTDAGETTPAVGNAGGKANGRRSSGHGKEIKVNVISVAADVLGKTADEVKEAIKGAKVGDLLTSAGKVDEFKAAYLAEARTKLDAAVTAGTLTQEEADVKYTEAEAKMAAYDGTAHLCGSQDHSKLSGRGKKSAE